MVPERVENEIIRAAVDTTTYLPLEEARRVTRRLVKLSFGCPIGNSPCGQVDEIDRDFSDRNVFVAIPYSGYHHENAIREVLERGELTPKIAKDKITSQVLLCKVCKELRKCGYGIADISKGNVNVAYELGLMQSLGKKCAILFSFHKASRSSRPTDLQGIENVDYKISRTLKRKLAQWIIDNIEECNRDQLRELAQNL